MQLKYEKNCQLQIETTEESNNDKIFNSVIQKNGQQFNRLSYNPCKVSLRFTAKYSVFCITDYISIYKNT